MGSFKVPTTVPQDLAMIMELVDPPQPDVRLEQRPKADGALRSGVAKSDSEVEDDIASSGTESEDEVEAEIVMGNRLEAA